MKLNHVKLDLIASTQEYLKAQPVLKDRETLVSTESQTSGHGRKGRSWKQFDQTICFSFSLPKRDNLTICSAEISLLTLEYLQQEMNFQGGTLKWPNDILNQQKQKIAGILIDVIREKILVGIGINIGGEIAQNDFNAASAFPLKDFQKDGYHTIPYEIFNYIYTRYPQPNLEIIHRWNSLCSHRDESVVIEDDQKLISGIFKGLGEFGEALVYSEDKGLEPVFSGTLRLDSSS